MIKIKRERYGSMTLLQYQTQLSTLQLVMSLDARNSIILLHLMPDDFSCPGESATIH